MAEEGQSRPVAAITGASAGIGAEFARQLAARGCDLLLIARREQRLRNLCERLRAAHGISCEVLPADLTRDEDIARVCETLRRTPRLRYLINNAGFGTLKNFAEADLAEQNAMARLHVLAIVNLTHAALAPMRDAGAGYIVNVSSVAGFFSSPSNVMYCSTKGWQRHFIEGLEVELQGSGIVVQALCPGFTYSEFHDVMGVDRAAVPSPWWLDARDVVAAALHGLDRRKTIVIPTWRYKLITAVLTSLPRVAKNALAKLRHRRMARHRTGADDQAAS